MQQVWDSLTPILVVLGEQTKELTIRVLLLTHDLEQLQRYRAMFRIHGLRIDDAVQLLMHETPVSHQC